MAEVEIIASIIGGLFGLIGLGISGWYKKKAASLELKANSQATELNFRADALSLRVEVSDWSAINEEIRNLMRETPVDRFFILNAFNGHHDPRWTTAIYQVVGEGEKVVSYIHFGIDQHYVDMLRHIHRYGRIDMSIEEIPDSVLRSVYDNEGVKHSLWYYVRSRELGSGSVGMTYCTFSSYSEVSIDPAVAARCEVIVNQIRGAIERVEGDL